MSWWVLDTNNMDTCWTFKTPTRAEPQPLLWWFKSTELGMSLSDPSNRTLDEFWNIQELQLPVQSYRFTKHSSVTYLCSPNGRRRHLKFELLRKFQKFFYHNHAHCFLHIFLRSGQNILVLNCGLTTKQRKVQGPRWLILCHGYPNQSAKEYWLIGLVRSCSTSRP